jgi:hypothetical protein
LDEDMSQCEGCHVEHPVADVPRPEDKAEEEDIVDHEDRLREVARKPEDDAAQAGQ